MRVSPRVEVSVSFMPLALAAVLFGPAAAAAVVGGGGDAAPRGPARAVPDLPLGQDARRVRGGVERGRGRADRWAPTRWCARRRGGRRLGRRNRRRVLRHRGDAAHQARHAAPRALEAPARLDRRLGGALRAGDRAHRIHLRARGRRGAGVLRRPADRRAPELRHARPPGAADRRAGGVERRSSRRPTRSCAGSTSASRQRWCGRSTRATTTPPATPRRLRSTHATSRASSGLPEEEVTRDPPGGPRARHRQDRPARGAAREAVRARRRRVGRDARHPAIGARILAEVEDYSDIALDRPQPPRALGRRRVSRRPRGPRDPAARPDHRRRRLVQRDDSRTGRTARR